MNTPLAGRANSHRAATLVALLIVALGLTACGGGGPGSKSLNLVIGNALPLSGVDKQMGASGEKASALAIERIRQAIHQVDTDQTVRTVQQDQGPDPTSASEAAGRLVHDRGASCLTGPWTSDAVAKTAQDVAIPDKALEISPVPTGDDVSQLSDHDLVDSTALPVSLEGSALPKAIEGSLGGAQGRTVNVAAAGGAYGSTLSQDFVQAWQDANGSVGSQTTLAQPASAAQVEPLLSNSPAAVLLIDDLNGFSQLAPSLSSARWDAEVAWGSDQLVSPGLPAQVGPAAVEGMRAVAPGSPQAAQASTAFAQGFKSAAPRGVPMEPYAAQEFDATVLCYLAAVAAGSTDGQEMADHLIDITAPGGAQYSWQQLPEAIKALQDGRDIDYTGASGPIDMDVHGDPTRGVFDVYRYGPSGLQVVGEVPVEQPNPATP